MNAGRGVDVAEAWMRRQGEEEAKGEVELIRREEGRGGAVEESTECCARSLCTASSSARQRTHR
jgi:hypothetical protein